MDLWGYLIKGYEIISILACSNMFDIGNWNGSVPKFIVMEHPIPWTPTVG
jgi:hypothetical protein